MDTLASKTTSPFPLLAPGKFSNPDLTAKGEVRASVALARLETLWINTGTLCNIACVNCYIESSPRNDRLAYITAAEARTYLDEIAALELKTREIGFTGGEPFLNPDMLEMVGDALSRGFEALILTNAMQPMQRPRVKQGLLELKQRYGGRLSLRVSLDHFTQALHEVERGAGAWARALDGLGWLMQNGFQVTIAGRTCWGETEEAARRGYARLFADEGYAFDAHDPAVLILFPEMDERRDVAEITTSCWNILDVDPDAIMCATSRMIVKRKDADRPVVMPCTLLPYEAAFEMGATLGEAAQADGGNFADGAVKLNHPHCARFCVLGGGACSVHHD